MKGSISMSRNGSLKYQIINKMKSMERFGESKLEAKKKCQAKCIESGEKWNPAKVEGIFSFGTFEAYKEEGMRFADYCQEHAIKSIDDVNQTIVDNYIGGRIENGESAWTVHKSAAAISKLFDIRPTVELPARSRDDITRSRGTKDHDSKINLENYSEIVDFAKACGARRAGLEKVCGNDIVYNDDGKLCVRLIEKGGKKRYAPVLIGYEDVVANYKDYGEKHIFEHIPSRIDIHSYRAQYAQARYEEVSKSIERSGAGYSTYKTRDGRTYNKDALLVVSKNLGHNRIDVVTKHYLK